nr:amidohydrolase family protein [Streptomyces sp. MUSC 14]
MVHAGHRPRRAAGTGAAPGAGGTGWSAASGSSWTAWSRAARRGWSTPTATGRAPPRWPDPRACAEAVRTLHAAGVRTAAHAIGNAAVRHVLDTVASLGPSRYGAHRIAHVETAPDELLPRCTTLGVTASLQPPHTGYTRDDGTVAWSRRLGGDRAGRA